MKTRQRRNANEQRVNARALCCLKRAEKNQNLHLGRTSCINPTPAPNPAFSFALLSASQRTDSPSSPPCLPLPPPCEFSRRFRPPFASQAQYFTAPRRPSHPPPRAKRQTNAPTHRVCATDRTRPHGSTPLSLRALQLVRDTRSGEQARHDRTPGRPHQNSLQPRRRGARIRDAV